MKGYKDSQAALEAEIEKAKKKQKYYEHQEKILERKLIPELTRKARTNRLCTRAGMLESFLVHPELLTNDQVMELLKIAFRQEEVKAALANMLEAYNEDHEESIEVKSEKNGNAVNEESSEGP